MLTVIVLGLPIVAFVAMVWRGWRRHVRAAAKLRAPVIPIDVWQRAQRLGRDDGPKGGAA